MKKKDEDLSLNSASKQQEKERKRNDKEKESKLTNAEYDAVMNKVGEKLDKKIKLTKAEYDTVMNKVGEKLDKKIKLTKVENDMLLEKIKDAWYIEIRDRERFYYEYISNPRSKLYDKDITYNDYVDPKNWFRPMESLKKNNLNLNDKAVDKHTAGK